MPELFVLHHSGHSHAAHAPHAWHSTHAAHSHITHSTHAVVMIMVATTCFFLDRNFGDQRLSGQQQCGNTGSVLQSGFDNFGWIDDAVGDQVTVLTGVGIKAIGFSLSCHGLD